MDQNDIFELSVDELEGVTGGKGTTVVAKKDGVNIRSGPGTHYAVVAKTTKGSKATYANETVFVDGKAWIRVTWGLNKSGWICSDYVKTN